MSYIGIPNLATGYLGNTVLSATGTGAGSGLFNTAISESVGYEVTDLMATAYTAPSTAGLRHIVYSIHITNIGTQQADITGQFSGATYSDITFGDTVPVPVESSVELLKKPKILQPDDLIQLQSSVAETLHATITLEETKGEKYFGEGVDVTSTNTFIDLYTATDNAVIESILLSNDDADDLDIKATVVWTDASDNIQGFFTFDIVVPNDATIEVLEQPKFIPQGFKVRVKANQPNRLEAIIAGKTV